jgi:hypothetical protein
MRVIHFLVLSAIAMPLFADCDYPSNTNARLDLLYSEACPSPPDQCQWQLSGCADASVTVQSWSVPGVPQPGPAELIVATDQLLLAQTRAQCAAEYEAEAVAVIDAGWPVLAQKQAAMNPPSLRAACYDEDLSAIDTALGSAMGALDGLSIEQLTPCPAVTWPAMRLYTQEQIDNSEVTTCEQ